MVTPTYRWSVDIYYSGFTNVVVEAHDIDEAIEKGCEEAERRLTLAQILDPDGAMSQLVNSLEPWEECDTARETN
jgi:vacuolar-type H+-ATPase subunit D/Vma8